MPEEKESPFKKGDMVRHKTGGPPMVYLEVSEYGEAYCTWVANGKKQADTFQLEELELYKPQGPGIAVV